MAGAWRAGSKAAWVKVIISRGRILGVTLLSHFNFFKSMLKVRQWNKLTLESMPMLYFILKVKPDLLSHSYPRQKGPNYRCSRFSSQGHSNRDIILHILTVKARRTHWMMSLTVRLFRGNSFIMCCCWFFSSSPLFALQMWKKLRTFLCLTNILNKGNPFGLLHVFFNNHFT